MVKIRRDGRMEQRIKERPDGWKDGPTDRLTDTTFYGDTWLYLTSTAGVHPIRLLHRPK